MKKDNSGGGGAGERWVYCANAIETVKCNVGVPHGSIVGPFWFCRIF